MNQYLHMHRIIITAALALLATGITQAQQPTDKPARAIAPRQSRVEIVKHAATPKSRATEGAEAWYMPPLVVQYYGMSGFDASFFETPIEVYPPDEQLQWLNLTEGDITINEWEYVDPATMEAATSHDVDLEACYAFDALSHAPAPALQVDGTLLAAPVLAVTDAEGYESEFASAPLMQVGGSAAYTGDEPRECGLMPFSPSADGIMTFVIDGVPVFGYSPQSDQWHTDYTFSGDPDPDEYVHCNAFFNTIIAPSTPLTVRGARLFACGKLDPDAVLKLQIYPTTSDGGFIYEPLAEATCAVADMKVTCWDGGNGERFDYEVPFVLDHPIDFTAQQSPFYLVGVTGFHGAAEWFAPYQSERPNPYELTLGYYRCTVSYDGEVDDWWMWQVADFKDAQGDYLYSTFAIALDASYPRAQGGSDSLAQPQADAAAATPACDLQGRPLAPGYRGAAIKDGAKLILR